MKLLVMVEVDTNLDVDSVVDGLNFLTRSDIDMSTADVDLSAMTVRRVVYRGSEPDICANCGAVEGGDEYDNFHDSGNCWADHKVGVVRVMTPKGTPPTTERY